MNRASRRPAMMVAMLLVGLLFARSTALAQNKEAPYEKGVTIEGITEYQLKNGCRFLLFPDPSSVKVTVNMTVLVGSRHEGYGETGMAHLLEHMLFKGSKLFPKVNDIDRALQAHGANPRDYNATTWADRTHYYESLPANDENLAFAIKLEADRLVNSFIRREDLVKEMTVVRNEFEAGENDPANILSQRMAAAAFEWHNYGKTTIGNRSDIERVPIESLQAFYKKYYRPDNVVVIVTGKFDQAKAIKAMVEYFGVLKAPAHKLPDTYTEEPPQDGERAVVLRRSGKVAVTGAVYHIPAASHEDHPAVEILSTVLGDSPSGRLYKALVEKKLATTVGASATAWHDPSLLEVAATAAEKVPVDQVRDAMIAVIEDVVANPPTKEEVERARKRYLSQHDQIMSKSLAVARQLNEWTAAGDWRLFFIYRDRIAKVTPEDVARVAAKYLLQSNRTVGVFYPTAEPKRSKIPETPDIAAMVKGYKGGKAVAEGEAFDPTPENLEKRTQRFTLPGGIKVALLPKKTRGEAVVGQVVLRFGNPQSLLAYKDACDYVGPMLMRGTKNRTREQIKDELDQLKSSLSARSDVGALSIGLSTKHKQLGAVLDLLREVLREPTFPDKEFGVLKDSAKQDILEAMADPQSLASQSIRRLLSPYPKDHIQYVPTFQEELERLDKLTIEDVRRLYQQQIGAQVGEISLVGDFDPAAVKDKLQAIFADWKTSVPYQRIERKAFADIKGNRQTIQVPDKENAVYVAGLTFPMRETDPDYAALLLANYMLGGGGFNSRLMDRLRQKEGWSYGAGSQVSVDAQDPRGAFVAFAICNPNVIEKVDKGALEEITRAVKDGFTDKELADNLKAYIQQRKTARGNDSQVVAMLQHQLHLGRSFSFTAELDKKFAALTLKDVNQALARHLDVNRLVIVRAGDFTKKAGPAPK